MNSESATVTVEKAVPTVTFEAITREEAKYVYGNEIYFNATVTGVNGEKPDGTVTFKDGNEIITTENFDSNFQDYSSEGKYLTAGDHSFTAVYNPSTDGIVLDKTAPAVTLTRPEGYTLEDVFALAYVQMKETGTIVYVVKTTEQSSITERLTAIGTFLSQGATVGKVKFILYLESFAYGLLGALFGSILGIAGLHVINRLVSPLKDYGIYGNVVIQPSYIILGTLFAVILSSVSAYLPVRRISKLQVKDIILNDVRISKSVGWKKNIIGTTLILISVALYLIVNENLGGYSALIIVSSLKGVILAYPKLIDLLSRLLYRFLRGKSKNVIYVINNLRTSKILLGNISLIIISLSSIIMITSLGSSMINVVTEAYTKLQFDIEIDNISTIRENTDESTADYLVKELKNLGIQDKQINMLNFQFGSIHNPKTNSDIPMTRGLLLQQH